MDAKRRRAESAAVDAAAILVAAIPENCGFLVLVYSHETDEGISIASDDAETLDRHIRIYQETRHDIPPTDVH